MSEDLDAEAERLLMRLTRAQRRPKPRTAPQFYDAEDALIETPFGAVQAWRLGEGPAVLLVHGWEDDHSLWAPLIDAFVDMQRAVVAFDLPGHGYSPAEEASFYSARAAVSAVAQHFGPIEALVAHSFGCPASVGAMEEGLDVARAVLIAPPIPSAYGRGRRLAQSGEFSSEAFERAAALYKARTGRELSGYDLEAAVARMKAPALFIHSLDDEQCPAENSDILSAAWPGAEKLITDNLGHRLIAQDEDIIRAIVAFVEGM